MWEIGWDDRPVEYEVESETEHYAVMRLKGTTNRPRRTKKQTGWHAFFDTPEEAVENLIRLRREEIERAEYRLDQAKSELKKAMERNGYIEKERP